MALKEKILEVREKTSLEIEKLFPYLNFIDRHHLAAYLVSSTCCFNRYRCYSDISSEIQEKIGKKRELKYIAVLCEKKIISLGYGCNFEDCKKMSNFLLDFISKDVNDIYMENFANEIKENYIYKIASFFNQVLDNGEQWANLESAWSLLSVLNNIEKNNEKWEFWHIHGIIREKLNYFHRREAFLEEKIYILSSSKEFWDIVCEAMKIYTKGSDLIIWIANKD